MAQATFPTFEEAPRMFGAKVVSCSASIGWGGQGGSLSLQLVEDPADGSSIDLPAIGTACFFQYHAFYFGGIFQRWSYSESSSGKLYDVVLESPSKLLDGIQVIMDEFQGTGFNEGTAFPGPIPNPNIFDKSYIDNVWNVFGELENHDATLYFNDGIGRHFGKANVNSAGFPVGEGAILPGGLSNWVLLSVISYLGNGRGDFGDKAYFGESRYGIDVSALQAALGGSADPGGYYRTSGSVQTLNAILSDIAEAVQVDYFVDLISGTIPGLFDGNGNIDEDRYTRRRKEVFYYKK